MQRVRDWGQIEQRFLDKCTYTFFDKIYSPLKDHLDSIESRISDDSTRMKTSLMGLLVKNKTFLPKKKHDLPQEEMARTELASLMSENKLASSYPTR